MTKQKYFDKLIRELDRSLIIEPEVHKYWLKNYKNLPFSAVELFCDQLYQINNRIDRMISAGLDANPGLAQKIVLKTKEAKKKAYKFLELQEIKESDPEKLLDQLFTN